MIDRSTLEKILDLARWAPSGDNSQPWTFRIVSDAAIQIIGTDHADSDVYDFDGRPTLLTLGFLLETVAIAASKFGARIDWAYRSDTPHTHVIDVAVDVANHLPIDPLLPFIETRSVARGRYRTDALTDTQKVGMARALGGDLEIRWFETLAEKWQITKTNARATHIRLSIPEAFTVHQRILDWRRDQSPDGVPSSAIGLDPMTLGSMQWVMKKWERAHFMNRFAGGTMVPRMEMDIVPGLACAAHFMVFQRLSGSRLSMPEQLIATGRSLQRFWLTATCFGLVMQPSLAPLCFSYYAEHERAFTTHSGMRSHASLLRQALKQVADSVSSEELIFMGRVGTPRHDKQGPRSTRKPLSSLMSKELEN